MNPTFNLALKLWVTLAILNVLDAIITLEFVNLDGMRELNPLGINPLQMIIKLALPFVLFVLLKYLWKLTHIDNIDVANINQLREIMKARYIIIIIIAIAVIFYFCVVGNNVFQILRYFLS